MAKLRASLTMLEAAIEVETRSMPSLSSTVRGQVAAACQKIGREIAAALEGQQRVTFGELCELVEKQVADRILEVSRTQPGSGLTTFWTWTLMVLAVDLVVVLWRCQVPIIRWGIAVFGRIRPWIERTRLCLYNAGTAVSSYVYNTLLTT